MTERPAAIRLRYALPFVLVGLTLWAVYALRAALTPVAVAFTIAYLLDPLADRLEARGLPRGAAITIVLAGVSVVVFGGLLIVVPLLLGEVVTVFREVPAQVQDAITAWEPVLVSYGVPIPHSISEFDQVLREASVDVEGIASSSAAPLATAVGWVLGGTANALSAIAGAVMIPVFAFYLLYDFDRIVAAVDDLLPRSRRTAIRGVVLEIDEVLSSFVRGQLAVMTILAVLYGVGYALVGVRLAFVIGIVAGLLSFIPYVGGASALGLALLMVALQWQGWWQVGAVVAVYAVIQIGEGFFITPKVVGDKVGLSSVWVLFALLVAGEALGFLGVLLAVPVAAVAKIFVLRGLAKYRASAFFSAAVWEEAEIDGSLTEQEALAFERGEELAGLAPDVAEEEYDASEEVSGVLLAEELDALEREAAARRDSSVESLRPREPASVPAPASDAPAGAPADAPAEPSTEDAPGEEDSSGAGEDADPEGRL